MRYIVIPESVVIDNQEGEKPPVITFQDFVLYTLLADKFWRQDDSHVSAAIEISDAVRGKQPGTTMELSNDAWDWLKTCLKEVPLLPGVAVYLFKLMKAITSASSEKSKVAAQ